MTTQRTIGSVALLSFILLILTAAPSLARQATLENVAPTKHGAAPGSSPTQIASAIKQAAKGLGWVVAGEEAGSVRLRIRLRAHMALVSVGFDETNYWIDYEDSTKLDYHAEDIVRKRPKRKPRVIEGPSIHHNYNNWIRNLSNRIRTEAARITPE